MDASGSRGLSLVVMRTHEGSTEMSMRSRVAVVLAAAMMATVGAVTSPGVAQAACPDGGYTSTPGERIKGPNNDTVYLVDPEGYKRPIVGGDNYLRIFRSWAGIKVRSDIACILANPAGKVVDNRNSIVQNGAGSYYWMEPTPWGEGFRGIPSVAVYDKYFFRWDTALYRSPAAIARNPFSPWT
jgi:hypothetical protein